MAVGDDVGRVSRYATSAKRTIAAVAIALAHT
jgi:hypothetical protein